MEALQNIVIIFANVVCSLQRERAVPAAAGREPTLTPRCTSPPFCRLKKTKAAANHLIHFHFKTYIYVYVFSFLLQNKYQLSQKHLGGRSSLGETRGGKHCSEQYCAYKSFKQMCCNASDCTQGCVFLSPFHYY